MRNWDFRIIYHFDGTAGNILDILHIHKEGSVGTEKIAVLHQLSCQIIQTPCAFQNFSVSHTTAPYYIIGAIGAAFLLFFLFLMIRVIKS